MFSVFGGTVDITGEILHGKTSPLRHDGRGLFAGLSQDIPVTRYHSLAGTHHSLPECLEITSWIPSHADLAKCIIMGVRHKNFIVEGVQFHPESILTAEGRIMLSNFLRFKGGTWAENEKLQGPVSTPNAVRTNDTLVNGVSHAEKSKTLPPPNKESILETIYAHRKAAVEQQKSIPSQRMSDLQAAYDMELSPPLISFLDRLRRQSLPLALAAEVKRASPSKGDIAPFICAPAQARKYALAGASVISVLTEPEWFKGSIEDLRSVRQSLAGMPDRPAVLRKEFIFDEYQILEARLAGADTILLIVKMLSPEALRRLYEYSRGLGMEPLVEINTLEEMDIATKLGARVIGINNRNLTNFEVDLDTTSRLMSGISKDVVVMALSGISGPADVEAYKRNGVGGVLVGEALMRHQDTAKFVKELMGSEKTPTNKPVSPRPMIKICGTRTVEAAEQAVVSGADFVGIILVEGRKRTVNLETAIQISKTVHRTSELINSRQVEGQKPTNKTPSGVFESGYFSFTSEGFRRMDKAMLVGVFQNQSLDFILEQQHLLDLDVVQLHGSEPLEWASLIPVPVIRRFGPNDAGIAAKPYHKLPLLDSAKGGTGESLDLNAIKKTLGADPELRVALAGGLNPANVGSVLSELHSFTSQIAILDVSSGVEDGGVQSLEKIRSFIKAVRESAKQ